MSLYYGEMTINILDAIVELAVNVEYRHHKAIAEGRYAPREPEHITIQRVYMYDNSHPEHAHHPHAEHAKDITWMLSKDPEFLRELERQILEEIRE